MLSTAGYNPPTLSLTVSLSLQITNKTAMLSLTPLPLSSTFPTLQYDTTISRNDIVVKWKNRNSTNKTLTGRRVIICTLTATIAKPSAAVSCSSSSSTTTSTPPPPSIREPHKHFDQAIITVRAGDGGHGAILSIPNHGRRGVREDEKRNRNNKKKANSSTTSSFKRDFDGSLILPVGGRGADVVIYADEGRDSLLEFHGMSCSRFSAKRGGNVDSCFGVLTSLLRDGLAAPALRIPVPLGTVVKRKKGKLLADLARPGDEVIVARGGQGGISLIDAPERRKKRLMNLTTNVMRDDVDKVDSLPRRNASD